MRYVRKYKFSLILLKDYLFILININKKNFIVDMYILIYKLTNSTTQLEHW